MILWIFFAAVFSLFILNIWSAVRMDDIIEKYALDVIKLVREDDLDITIPIQVPLNHHQKLGLIAEIKRLPDYIENEMISENEAAYSKINRFRNLSGLTMVGIVFIPLLLKYLF